MSKFKYFEDGSWEFDSAETDNQEFLSHKKDFDIFVSGTCENPNLDALKEAEYTINISMSEILEKIKKCGCVSIGGCLNGNLENGIRYYYSVTNADERSFIIPKDLLTQDPQTVYGILGRNLITNYDVAYIYVGTKLSEYCNKKDVFEPYCIGMFIFEDDTPDSPTYGKIITAIRDLPF